MTKQRVATLTVLPDCDLCKLENPLSKPEIARYDAPIAGNGWAYLCCYHYKGYAVSLGTKLEAGVCEKCGNSGWIESTLPTAYLPCPLGCRNQESSLESGAVEQEIILARQQLAEEGA